jgi:hypothetical protein
MKQLAVILISTLSLVACSSSNTSTHYYSLQTPNVNSIVTPHTVVYHSLGVGPIKLPSLLDREGVVMRTNAHSLHISDKYLWGGQLEDEFLRALSRQLQVRLPNTLIQMLPWEIQQSPQAQIVVQVDQFDGQLGQQAVLSGHWELQQPRDGKIKGTQNFNLVLPLKDKQVDTLINAQAQLVAQLATQIAASL